MYVHADVACYPLSVHYCVGCTRVGTTHSNGVVSVLLTQGLVVNRRSAILGTVSLY